MTESSPKLLIVDDKPKNIHALKRLLEPLNLDIVEATSGLQALKQVINNELFLILMDVQMPEMNGFETATLILENQASAHIPIIFVTAISKQEHFALQGYETGAVDYLYKPIQPVVLLSKVRIMLDFDQQKRDIKEALHEQQRSEETIKALLDSQLDSAMLIDTEGNILALNQIAMLHLEKQEQDIVGRSFYDLSPQILLAERKRYISEAVESRRLVKFEEDNGDMIYDVHLCPILNTIEDNQLETDTLEKITRVAIFSRDITIERNNERELVQLANFDHLTGLNNRTFFNSYQKALLKQAKRNKRPIATLFLDLDHFKEINDTWGHDTGDKLLKSVAHRLLACTREGDLVARLGGDEFAILLIDIKHPDQAAIVAQKLLDSFAKPHQLEGHEIFSGCSVGIACYPECGSNPEEMNKAADAAMYQAKRQGRNRYCFYDPALQEHNLNKAFLVNALRQALQNKEISVLYQIKVRSSNKEIAGVEALARWNHSERGSVPPSVFIPLAEEFGLISDIGEWVLRTACADIKQLQNQFGFDNCLKISVAVNVSPRQLKDLDFSEKVKNVLNELKVEPECLQIELTESSIMEDPEASIEILGAVRDVGISIAIDDFGTGYSSLSYLSRLPIDTVKIDLSFVQQIGHSRESESIIKATIALAHTLGLNTIAEGVETAAQIEFLCQEKCQYLQGYYFSKPIGIVQLAELLKEDMQP